MECSQQKRKYIEVYDRNGMGPCNQVFDLICRKYPSIRYYFQSEEPGMVEYLTNDKEGKYFKDKYCVDVYTPEKEFKHKHFLDEQCMYKWLGDILDTIVTSADDIEKQNKRWYDTGSSAFATFMSLGKSEYIASEAVSFWDNLFFETLWE